MCVYTITPITLSLPCIFPHESHLVTEVDSFVRPRLTTSTFTITTECDPCFPFLAQPHPISGVIYQGSRTQPRSRSRSRHDHDQSPSSYPSPDIHSYMHSSPSFPCMRCICDYMHELVISSSFILSLLHECAFTLTYFLNLFT